jgi:hypothetical protein
MTCRMETSTMHCRLCLRGRATYPHKTAASVGATISFCTTRPSFNRVNRWCDRPPRMPAIVSVSLSCDGSCSPWLSQRSRAIVGRSPCDRPALPLLTCCRGERTQAKQVVDAVVSTADVVLSTYPLTTIIDKPRTPPNADKRFYMTVGPYYWPSPNGNASYVHKDGEFNPDVRAPNPCTWIGQRQTPVKCSDRQE